jgi:hypothetical protein
MAAEWMDFEKSLNLTSDEEEMIRLEESFIITVVNKKQEIVGKYGVVL